MTEPTWAIDMVKGAATREIEAFAEKLRTNPVHAFEWGNDAVRAAAELELVGMVEHTVCRVTGGDEEGNHLEASKAIELLDEWAHRQIRESARLSASTSAMSNLTNLARAEVATKWFDEMSWRVNRKVVAKALGC